MDIFYPIQLLANSISNYLFPNNSYLGDVVSFFIYDVIKIGLLLLIINYIMAITRYYFPTEKIRDILKSRRWFGIDYLLAALLGMITPFCSCSSIPLFIGFLSSGIPLGITFTFLISSPLINESSLLLFPSIFGWETTILYNLIGITISILGGLLIEKLKLTKYVNQDLIKIRTTLPTIADRKTMKLIDLAKYFWKDGFIITKKVFPYVILGVFIGALIHSLIPEELISSTLVNKQWWAVPIATLLGIPLYANSVSVVPIAEALIGKGIPLGTILAFMTATVTLSIPEALILKKAMKWQLLAIFFAITTFGIILLGYIFNLRG
jgi:hypothetical protein